ncbi:MAG: DNA alkylation repair protein, partial [bacterium]
LVSEGTRPRLPLSFPLRQFKKDPTPVIALLELLKDDPELYVRRSVANNLNDISKDNPQTVVALLDQWKQNATKERMWLITHSLRTLFKRGNKDALALLNYHSPAVDQVQLTVHTTQVAPHKELQFTVEFKSTTQQKLMIDYRIHYMKASGRQAIKVFKLAIKNAKSGETIRITSKQSFRKISTRKHYPGKHCIDIMINGEVYEQQEFEYLE